MPIDITEHSPNARRKAATKRMQSGKTVYDLRRLIGQLGTLTMNRIEPSGPGFAVFSSPTPAQAQALRLLNVKIPTR